MISVWDLFLLPCSILPVKVGVLLADFVGALHFMDSFKGRAKKDWKLYELSNWKADLVKGGDGKGLLL